MGIVSDLSQGKIPCVPQRFSQLTHDLVKLLLFRPVFYLMSDLNVNQAPHGIGALPWPAETQSPVNPSGFLMDTVAFYSGAPVSTSRLTPPPISRCAKQQDAQWRCHSNKSQPGYLNVAPLRHLSLCLLNDRAQEGSGGRVGGILNWGVSEASGRHDSSQGPLPRSACTSN